MPKIKFCGFKDLKDIQAAIDLGVDYIGLNFIPQSPRHIDWKQGLEFITKAKSRQAKFVAVLRDPSQDFVLQILNSNLFTAIQFHGQEDIKFLEEMVNSKKEMEFWKAISISNKSLASVESEIVQFPNYIDRFLLDVDKKPDLSMGQEVFSALDIYKHLASKYHLILAGGLNPENVKSLLEKLQPEMIDVASGIEADVLNKAGYKDMDKMKKFIKPCQGN